MMAHLLLVDDDPALIPGQVRHASPAPAHRVEVAGTGAEGLGVFTIHLPPLRQRGDDLPMLVQHYLRRFSRELGREVREADPEALERLRNYPWPGNIRGLQSVLKHALLKATGPVLVPPFLRELLGGPGGPPLVSPPRGKCSGLEAFIGQRLESGTGDLYAQAHLELDRILLPRVLEHARGSQHQADRVLGIARKTLRLRLRKLGLNATRPADAADDDRP